MIRNPVTGETVTFLVTADESGGSLMKLEMTADPNARGAPEHVHSQLTETYDVQSGRLHVRLRGEERVLEAGDTFEFPRGEPHRFWNADDAPATVVVEFRPAGGFERFMETVYALAADGKTNAEGTPKNFLQAAVIANAHLDDIALAKWPLWLQRIAFGALAPLGRLFGFRPTYP